MPRAFSLIELVVVLAVTLILTSLLMPTLSQVRENVNRVHCSSNQRQLGLGVMMFARDNKDDFPIAQELEIRGRRLRLVDLTTARLLDPDQWDGLGILFKRGYCAGAECFYCPSHRGTVAMDPYQWRTRTPTRIYTNYSYSGHEHWESGVKRSLVEGAKLVLSVDALSGDTQDNHNSGMNVLRGDGSVRWHEDPGDHVASLVQDMDENRNSEDHRGLWEAMEGMLNR